MTLMTWVALAVILAPAALGGWIAGNRRGFGVLLGVLLSLPTLLALGVLTDNAGDPPDAYPSTVLMIVFIDFMSFTAIGSFFRERKSNAFQQKES